MIRASELIENFIKYAGYWRP